MGIFRSLGALARALGPFVACTGIIIIIVTILHRIVILPLFFFFFFLQCIGVIVLVCAT